MKIFFRIALILLFPSFQISQIAAQTTLKARTIITTDGEIDDVDSYIRMLLYSNDFYIEGLIYSSSMWHYKGDRKGTTFISEMEMTRKLYGEKTDDPPYPGSDRYRNPAIDPLPKSDCEWMI